MSNKNLSILIGKTAITTAFIASSILFTSNSAHADHLTIYWYPSPVGVNWKNPHRLAWSIVGNYLKRKKGRMIGHASIEIYCSGADGQPEFYEFTGQTNTDKSVHSDGVLKKHLGLGVMYNAVDGIQETPAKLQPELESRYKNGRVSFVHTEVSPAACRRAQSYLAEYRSLNLDKIYGGLQHRARYQEGAGCSSFATSFYEIAGVMNDDFESGWTKFVRVPDFTMGNPETGYKVKLMDLLFNPVKYKRWAYENEPHKEMAFWDPDRAHRWVKRKYYSLVHQGRGKYQPEVRGKAVGLMIDARNNPVPTESFWKNESEML